MAEANDWSQPLSDVIQYKNEPYRLPRTNAWRSEPLISRQTSPTSLRSTEDEGVHTMDSEDDDFAAVTRSTAILKSVSAAALTTFVLPGHGTHVVHEVSIWRYPRTVNHKPPISNQMCRDVLLVFITHCWH